MTQIIDFISTLFLWIFTISIAIFILWLLFIVVSMAFKTNKQIKTLKKEDEKLEDTRQKRRDETNSSLSYADFIDSLKGEFKIPEDVIYDIKSAKDSKVAKDKLNAFMVWIKQDNSKLLTAVKNNKYLEVVVPKLLIDVIHTVKTGGMIKSPEIDENFSAYNITKWLCIAFEQLSAKDLVNLLNYTHISEYVASEIFGDEGSWREYESELSSEFYTEGESLKVPENIIECEYGDYFTENISGGGFSGPVADGGETLYCTIDILIWDEKFSINGSDFKFKKSDKEYLITLLMASYKPSLLKRIKEGLE